MLECCNLRFGGEFSRVLINSRDFYRKIEYGICPNCGCSKYRELRQVNGGAIREKLLSGKEALHRFEKISEQLSKLKRGNFVNQNFYYGDFKKTRRKDEFGNPVYLQLRKNFNNTVEILGEIRTTVTYGGKHYEKEIQVQT